MKLVARELRKSIPGIQDVATIHRNPVYIIVDNVLDTYNIGSIFRLADAVAVAKVILCGQTERPPHTRIKKASINTTEWVPWEYYKKTTDAIAALRREVLDIQIVAVEQDAHSLPYTEATYLHPVALIVGHETSGVSQEVLSKCDSIVELPMWGINVSLNVVVSLGIALYEVMRQKTAASISR